MKKKIIALIIMLISFIVMLIIGLNSTKTIQATNNKSNTYKILVDVEESTLYLLENNVRIKEYKCSGGKWSTPSPIGTWKIVQKAKWGEGFRRELDAVLMYHGGNLEFMAH